MGRSLPSVAMTDQFLIEAGTIVKSFGQTQALRGASVGAAHGEILAIMGPSGSGKSTLLRCLAGIFPPDSGEVWFDGRRLDTLKLDSQGVWAHPVVSPDGKTLAVTSSENTVFRL